MMCLSLKQAQNNFTYTIHSDKNLALPPPNPSLQEILHKAGQPLPHGKGLPHIAQELINLSQILNRFVIQHD